MREASTHSASTAATTAPLGPPADRTDVPRSGERQKALRVGLVCDYREEKWASMDLVADLLLSQFAERAPHVDVSRILPAMPRFFSRFPVAGTSNAAFNLDRFLGRYISYPSRLRPMAASFDVLHIVDQSYAHLVSSVPHNRTVVTCHDLDVFRSIIEPQRDPRPAWFRSLASRVMEGFRSASHVIAVSEPVRDEILAHGLIPPSRLTVVPNGIDPFCGTAPDPTADAHVSSLLTGVNAADPLLLHVGTTIPRKRIDLLLRIFAKLLDRVPQAWLLRLGGGLNAAQQEQAKQLGITGRIINLPYLDRRHVAAVYRRADLLLLPSESEGFGLPIIEAFASETPVLASDIAVLRSVGRHFADYCPVGDIDAWNSQATALLESLRHEDSRKQLRTRALSGAADYQWPNVIESTTAIYQRVFAEGRSA